MSSHTDFVFPESLNIQKMSPFYLEMKKIFLKKKSKIILDLRPLKSLDFSIIQILANFVKLGLEKDMSITLIGPLDPLLQDSLEEMDIIRVDSSIPILFEQISGGLKIECQ